MKKYRLKKEVKKYFANRCKDDEQPLEYWSLEFGVSAEALEEVPSRIELGISNLGNLFKETGNKWTDQEKDLCEKALNGELLDIDSLDGFEKWYSDRITSKFRCDLDIKGVLKQYLNER